MKRILLLVTAVFLLLSGIATAQEYFDVLYLKNGDIIRGVIVEGASLASPSAYVKIETGNGSIITVLYADILKFTREKKAVAPPPEIVQPAQPVHAKSLGQPRAPIEFRKVHEWVNMALGFKMGFLLGDDKDLEQLWNQAVPAPTEITWDEKHTSMGMGLDFDLMLRPDDKFSIGPFFAANFMAPGATGELKWTTTGYWYSFGDYLIYFPPGEWYTKHKLDFSNVIFGARARAIFPVKDPSGAEVANLSLEFSIGNLSLAGAGYRTYLDNSLVQWAEFTGSSTYYAFGAGVSAYTTRFSSLSAKFGYQSAGLDKIKFEIIQDDYSTGDEGRTGTVTSGADGSNITVSFKEIFMTIAWTLMF
ncbi:MAG: hypothetical protein Q8O74_03185 [bacterium]|nr:hypothetical protein [bacterium]